MTIKTAPYAHGHHESVLRSHSWRTAANSAAYLLPLLKSHMHILDIGCGPGTISVGLAKMVPDGKVIGLEYAPDVLEKARAIAADKGVQNIEFVTGNVHALTYPDATFDVVHAHQVLQHLGDPVQALREMRRVTKPGGIIAVRDYDFSGMTWYPEPQALDDWLDLYYRVSRSYGGEPDAGRRLKSWARQAGFEPAKVTCSTGTWCFSTPEDIAWWSGLWADRTTSSEFARRALEEGHATQDELDRIAKGWRAWGKDQDAWLVVLHGEVIARV